MTPLNLIVGLASAAITSALWFCLGPAGSSPKTVIASPPATANKAEPAYSSPDLLDTSISTEKRTQEETQLAAAQPVEVELLDGRILMTDFENGVLTVCGFPFDQLNIEAWPQDKLLELNRAIRPLQIELKREFVASNPTEHLFVTTEAYFAQKMWHTTEILHGTMREVPDENGKLHVEYGYMRVPRSLSPNEYVLTDAVERIYRAPSYAEYLLTEGEAYTASIMAEHPDAHLDFSDDLTRWVLLDPAGKVVGWQSYSRFGDN